MNGARLTLVLDFRMVETSKPQRNRVGSRFHGWRVNRTKRGKIPLGAYVDVGPQVMGVMHSTIASTYPALARLRERWQGPTMAYPETIGTDASGKRKGTSCTPDDFARHCVQMVEDGVQIIGGCCGTTIAHLQALTHRLDRQAPD